MELREYRKEISPIVDKMKRKKFSIDVIRQFLYILVFVEEERAEKAFFYAGEMLDKYSDENEFWYALSLYMDELIPPPAEEELQKKYEEIIKMQREKKE